MNNILYTTGAFYQFTDINKIISLLGQINADGYELMITKNWLGYSKEWVNKLKECSINFPIGHLSKSSIVRCYESGDSLIVKEGHSKLKENCEILHSLNINKAVMHLWGWPDKNFDNVLKALKEAVKISSWYNIELLIETLPCCNESLIRRLEQVTDTYSECRFTLDIRLLRYCNMQDEIFSVDWIWEENRVAHVHISDCRINTKGQVMVRPALQPGEGIIDFDLFFKKLKVKKYTGAITLEFLGYDNLTGKFRTDQINRAVDFIRSLMRD